MKCLPLAMLAFSAMMTGSSMAAEPAEYTLVIRGNAYVPSSLQVPAGTSLKLHVRNENSTPSEFESNDFNREQIVLPGTTATVYVGPLDKGRYTFFDDFHRDNGHGVLIVQ